jgi:hypothetical protein
MPEQVNQNFLLSPWRNEETWWACNMTALLRTHITDCLPRFWLPITSPPRYIKSCFQQYWMFHPHTCRQCIYHSSQWYTVPTTYPDLLQSLFFFYGLLFRNHGWWRHPHVSYPITRLNSSKCLPLVRFKMDKSTSFCYNTQVCKTKITTC